MNGLKKFLDDVKRCWVRCRNAREGVSCLHCYKKLQPNNVYFMAKCSNGNNCQYPPNRKFIFPFKARCKLCKTLSTERYCGHCKNPLYKDLGFFRSRNIVIVGGQKASKTHFIYEFMRSLEVTRMAQKALIHNNREYEDLYYAIFPKDSRMGKIAVTTPTQGLCFCVKLYGNKLKEVVLLPFYDVKGEDFERAALSEKMQDYVEQADGVIVLLDCCQIETIRNAITGYNPSFPSNHPKQRLEQHEFLHKILDVIKLPGDRGVYKPVAICLSKIDIIENAQLDHQPANLCKNEGLNSEELKKFIQEVIYPNLDETALEMARGGYEFFAVAPIGEVPRNDNTFDLNKSIRVSDPFIWLLKELDALENN